MPFDQGLLLAKRVMLAKGVLRRDRAQKRFRDAALLFAVLLVGVVQPARALPLSAKDVQIIAKAMGFLDPAPAGGMGAVVYTDAATESDADAIVANFGAGLASSGGTITAKAVDVAGLGDGSGYVGIILASGVSTPAANAAAKAHKIPCITADTALVQSGGCTMAVQSDPKVSITVNHAAAQAAGISFASAFAMLIHEI
jgi:hypothetical protein